MMEALQASEGRVDLWYTYQDLAIDSRLLETYAGLLSEDESVRWRRFLFERDRRRFLIARAMLRDVVSRYVGCEPCSLAFEYNPYGKPALASPPGQSIRFNLSHSAGLAVCAVTRGHDVGVDVESPERRTDVLGLARRFFAESEVAALGRRPPEEQRRTFFEYWTLKEAYIKACGRGLSIPLDAFGFTLRADRPPTIGFAAGMADDPGDWQFAQVFLGQDYPIALALRSCREEEMTVGIRRIIPLQRAGDAAVLPCNGLRRWTLESEFPELS
ncbi:MAG: 4'-phosphopantetheinyl transferase superfamily protein [Rhodopirellula sp.]|nr:4'-phosphopantetheinyl transferase superfamily protein [Rhodopirellula sp.]